MVNKSKTTGENTFTVDPFIIESNRVSSKDQKTLFWKFTICE